MKAEKSAEHFLSTIIKINRVKTHADSTNLHEFQKKILMK